jgi:hypothetical protein
MVLDRQTDWERVVEWRLEELERAGYDTPSARRLAERPDIDLHLAVALVRGGCPAEIALSILL